MLAACNDLLRNVGGEVSALAWHDRIAISNGPVRSIFENVLRFDQFGLTSVVSNYPAAIYSLRVFSLRLLPGRRNPAVIPLLLRLENFPSPPAKRRR